MSILPSKIKKLLSIGLAWILFFQGALIALPISALEPEASISAAPKLKKLSLSKKDFQAKEEMEIILGDYQANSLKISVVDRSGEEIPIEIKIKEGVLKIKPPRNFRPGKYTLKISESEQTIFERDFSWGVLAINTHKSIYLPNEKVNLAMAVLDEEGKMVCDAKLVLQIQTPQSEILNLSTEEGTIKVNPECQVHDFTMRPDYEATYQVGETGVYQLKLTAETKNGSFNVTDSFEVRETVAFDIERESATRIYPPKPYPVTFKIAANQDFEGVIEETVPVDFEIFPPIYGKAYNKISEEDRVRIISWEVSLKKGDKIDLGYYFDAPDISPQLYLLGPLKFKTLVSTTSEITPASESAKLEATSSAILGTSTSAIFSMPSSPTTETMIFQEARQWQIAADADTGAKTAGSASSADWTGWTTANLNSSDGTKATYGLVGSATGTLSGFVFDVPVNVSSIDGILVQIEGRESNPSCNGYFETSLSWNDGTDYTTVVNRSPDTGALDKADTVYNEGGATATWNHTWTVDEINNHFMVKIVGTNAKAKNIEIDHVQVTVYYTMPVVDSWTGTVYTDDDESQTIANGTSVCAVVNNGTPACSTTTSGVFTINTLNANAGDQLTFFIDGGSILGNTVTISDGGDIVGANNLRIYQNHVVVRYEQGTAISILDMDAYDDNQNPDDMLFDAEDSDPDTLSVESNIELFVYSGFTFTPNGTITLRGDFTNNGAFNAGSGEVIFAGGDGSTQSIVGNTTFYDFTASTEINASGRTLQFAGNSTQTVSGTWTITGYSGKVITLQSSDTNNWTINPTNASVIYVDVSRSTNSGVSFCATYSNDGGNNNSWNISSGATCNQVPNSPTSLAQKKTDDTVLNVGDWTNETSVKFTATADDPDNPDTLYLCVEKDILGIGFSNSEDSCGAGVAYSGTPVTVTVTISSQTDDTEYHWQARVKDEAGEYSSWVSYGGNSDPNDRDYGIDTSAPTGGTVYDGTEAGVDKDFNDGLLSQLSANWDGVDTTVSGLDYYEYSIGTSAGGTDVKVWTDNGTSTSVTVPGLTLQTSQVYYFNVRAVDNAGNIQSPVISSDGQQVAPSVTFSVAPSSLSFDNLNSNNNFTDTKTATLTTSTNAYGGYVIRSFTTDVLTSTIYPSEIILNFNGGTYDLPDEWLSGDRGFGYHSSDTLIQGSNKFNGDPCPGGGAWPCYAPFSQTGPGDIIADHTDNVTGNPISDEQFTVTCKVKTDEIQPASPYVTTIVYTVTAQY